MKFRLAAQRASILAASILLFLHHSAPAQGNLVFNGGFNTNAAGWTLSNGASWPWGVNPSYAVGLDNISPSPFTDPTASQTINGLIPGTTYIVSGDYLMGKDRGGGSPTDPSFGVAIDGTFLFQAVAPGNVNWPQFSFNYTASASSALLSLSSQINGTGVSYIIDNIAVQVIPEPHPAPMLLLGLMIIGVFSRCRFKASSPR